MELAFQIKNFHEHSLAIYCGKNIAQVGVLHGLHLVNEEGADLDQFLLQGEHVVEGSVVHDIYSKVISHDIEFVGLVFGDLVDAVQD